MGWLKRYQDARRAGLAEFGIGVDAPQPWPDDPPPQWNGPRESGDPAPYPPDPGSEPAPDPGSGPGQADAGAAARTAELEAQLAGLQEELRSAHETHEKDDRLIKELQGMVDQDQAHTAELEALAEQLQAEWVQFAEVLKLRGLKRLLEKTYFPDMHSKATETEKRALTEYAQTINVVYDLIKQDDRAKKSDDEAA